MEFIKTRTARLCRRCKQVTLNKCGYCEDCWTVKQRTYGWEQTQKEKGTSAQRGYGSAWRKIRERVLKRDNYLCQECLRLGFYTPANQCDHIIPKSKGGTDDLSNLQSLCYKCHKEKTNKEDKGGMVSKGVY